jgi:hypothetical protein
MVPRGRLVPRWHHNELLDIEQAIRRTLYNSDSLELCGGDPLILLIDILVQIDIAEVGIVLPLGVLFQVCVLAMHLLCLDLVI